MKVSSETELAEAIRGATGPFQVRGGGTRDVGRPVAGAVLDVSGIAGIRLYEPEALTLVAGAGTPLSDVAAALRAQRQRLAFEPPDWRALLGTKGTSTLGGMVATNASGSRRVQAGACRDALLGVRFVDGTGATVKNGGRVMKNVTGYDLVKLIAGSWGTLGVLSEVSLKVLPVPEATATLIVELDGASAALAALSAALVSPHDVTGAAFLPGKGALVRIEGFAASVRYRAERLESVLAPHGSVSVETDPEQGAALWRRVTDAAPFADLDGDVWRLSVKPSDAPEIVARLGCDYFLDWGGGLIWARIPEGGDLRARLGEFSGHATLMRASVETRGRVASFHPEPPAIAALTKELRAKFDPRGILNPARMD